MKENGIKNDFCRTWCPVHVCMFTDRLFFPWMVVPGRWRSPLRQGSWRQCPPPTLSLPQLSPSTYSHLAGSSYSRPRYVQFTVRINVWLSETPQSAVGGPFPLVACWLHVQRHQYIPFLFPLLAGQLPHYKAEASGPAPVTAGGSQKRRRRGCRGSLQATQGAYSLVPCSVTISQNLI